LQNQNPLERPYGTKIKEGAIAPLRNLFNKPQLYSKLFENQDRELFAQMRVKMSDFFQEKITVSGLDPVCLLLFSCIPNLAHLFSLLVY
jgi:hypothetical protein